jgi:hypothetical protein
LLQQWCVFVIVKWIVKRYLCVCHESITNPKVCYNVVYEETLQCSGCCNTRLSKLNVTYHNSLWYVDYYEFVVGIDKPHSRAKCHRRYEIWLQYYLINSQRIKKQKLDRTAYLFGKYNTGMGKIPWVEEVTQIQIKIHSFGRYRRDRNCLCLLRFKL